MIIFQQVAQKISAPINDVLVTAKWHGLKCLERGHAHSRRTMQCTLTPKTATATT